jgi:ABC-2 type transport system ATP-binding protein
MEMTTKNAIEAAKITKELKNFTLDVENFAIPQGFATALIGENGAGKTTLLNILAGIRLDYKGEITYFGQYSDKQKENSGDIKNRIGYTGPGKYYLPQWTVKDIEEISKLMFDDFSADDFHRYCEELAIFSHGSIDMKKANSSFSSTKSSTSSTKLKSS